MKKTFAGLVAGFVMLPVWAAADDGDVFSRLDANKDGYVAADEVDGDKQRLFERLLRTSDADKDGKLSREEFAAATDPSRARPDEPAPAGDRPRPPVDPRQLFEQLDKNNDGKLAKDELPEPAQANFDRVDADGSGSVELPEFARALAAFAQQNPGDRPRDPRFDPRRFSEIFDRADANGDGKLSLSEVPEDRQAQFKQALERFDDDADEALTREQFIRAAMIASGGQDPTQPNLPQPPRIAPNMTQPGMLRGAVLLRVLDRDGDGALSAEEVSGAAESLAKLDRNGDGAISGPELLPQGAFRDQPQGGPAEFLLRRVREADKNGDGKLSKDEAPEPLRLAFDRLDANSDGQLDADELRQGLRNLRPYDARPE